MIIRSINALVGEKTDKKHMLFLLFFFLLVYILVLGEKLTINKIIFSTAV